MNRDNKNGRPARQDAPEEQGQTGRDAQQGTGSEETPIYLTGNSTLQSPDEHARDSAIDPRDDNRTDIGNDDLHEVRLGRMTGWDVDGNDSDQV
ncbi:hypothetical protein [Flaviaesturariibacter amylovorans]|uniref:Uncharacterized protein n=1 Tax=Flaviaesturariibacter amylovorans TaxID=1084520 RepID=A0ABP8GGN9_9BACT